MFLGFFFLRRSKSSAQGDKKLKERPVSKWNKGSGNLRARPHADDLPTPEKELKKILNSERNRQQQKADTNVIKGCVQVPVSESNRTLYGCFFSFVCLFSKERERKKCGVR